MLYYLYVIIIIYSANYDKKYKIICNYNQILSFYDLMQKRIANKFYLPIEQHHRRIGPSIFTMFYTRLWLCYNVIE